MWPPCPSQDHSCPNQLLKFGSCPLSLEASSAHTWPHPPSRFHSLWSPGSLLVLPRPSAFIWSPILSSLLIFLPDRQSITEGSPPLENTVYLERQTQITCEEVKLKMSNQHSGCSGCLSSPPEWTLARPAASSCLLVPEDTGPFCNPCRGHN